MNKKVVFIVSAIIIFIAIIIGVSTNSDKQNEVQTPVQPVEMPEENVYNNEDILATLDGKEIKVKDLLMIYPIEERYIEIYLKEEVMMMEAKKVGINIDIMTITDIRDVYFPTLDKEENKEFYETQAEKLDMPAEEYYLKWASATIERDLYLDEYLDKNFEAPTSEEEAKEINQKIDEHFSQLFKQYQDSGILTIH